MRHKFKSIHFVARARHVGDRSEVLANLGYSVSG